MNPFHLELDLTELDGRLFAIGDVHGRLRELIEMLETIGFDFEKDVIIFLGDLFDRGKENYELLQYLKPYLTPTRISTGGCHQPFYTVWGNHEEIIHHALSGDVMYLDVWMRNGGGWYTRLSDDEGKELEHFIRYLASQAPIAYTVKYHNKCYGFTHAEVPCDDWEIYKKAFKYRYDSLWSRVNIRRKRDFTQIRNIEKTFHGHSPYQYYGKKPIIIGNQYWLDGGSECFLCREIKPNGKIINWDI